MILGAEPKNQVIWTIRCKVMALNLSKKKTQNLHFLKKPQGFDLFESCSSNYYIKKDFSLKQNVWDILFE